MQRIDTTTKRLLANPQKRRAWVIYQLLLKNRTLADVARDAGVKRQTLYHSFTRPYPRMERAIAEALGLQPQVLFADRYDQDGLPTRRKGIGNGRKSAGQASAASCHGGKNSAIAIKRNAQMRVAA